MLNRFPSLEETSDALKQRMNGKRARILGRASDYDWIDASPAAQEQLNILRDQAKSRGLKIVNEVELHTSPHLNQPSYRSALSDLIAAAHAHEYDVLMVTSLDRLTRSGERHMSNIIRELEDAGVIVFSLREQWLSEIPLRIEEFTEESARRMAGLLRRTGISLTADSTAIEGGELANL